MIRRIFIAAALTALFASLVPAQRGGGGGGGGGQMGGGGGFGRGPQIDKSELLATEFKLTPAQRTAVEAIMDDAQKQADPLVLQIIAQMNAQLQASRAGKDTGGATKKLAEVSGQVLVIEADAFAKALAKLDDKQKKNAPKLFEMMAGMFAVQGGWRKSN